jgi:hypothetical protein
MRLKSLVGTRAPLRMFLVGAILAAGVSACDSSIGLPADSTTGLRYPIALVADPSGRQVFALGANFDRLFRAGRMRTIDTATDQYVVDKDGAPIYTEVASFGGDFAIDVAPDPTATTKFHLFVPTRDDDALVTLDVHATTPTTMDCNADAVGICGPDHRIAALDGIYPVGDDPIAVALSDSPDGRRRVHIAAANNGYVTLMDYDPWQQPVQLRELDQVSLPGGLNSIVVSKLSQRAYVTTTRTAAIQTYRVDPGPSVDKPWIIVQEPSIVLPASALADYGRGLAFSSDSSRLYVAWRSPAALDILDVVPDATGQPGNRLVDTIVLGRQPSGLAVAPTGPNGRDQVYVSCYSDDAIWVVDPVLRAPVARIAMRLGIHETGLDQQIVRGSPFAMAAVNVPDRGWQLYAGLFAVPPGANHQIVVVPIAPGAKNLNFADHIVHVGGAL